MTVPGFAPHGAFGVAAIVLFAASCVAQATPLNEPIKPLPAGAPQDPARVQIGRQLFNDPRLSVNRSVSCASCHNLAAGGADGRRRSIGFSGLATPANAPPVLNAALNFRQFWSGGADSLEAQIGTVVESPIEMGSRWRDVVAMAANDAAYRSAFAAAYKDGVTRANIENAIATYERTLVTPNARFDKYLRGDINAISAEERAGYLKFKQYGCVACHQGVNVGGNMFQKFGVMKDLATQHEPGQTDVSRFSVTGLKADRQVFKVPSLRNVALTAPYLHDGSAATLAEAVEIMFRHQLGRSASAQDKAQIVLFLGTLTGEPARP